MENCVAPGLDEFDVIIRSCIVFSQSTTHLGHQILGAHIFILCSKEWVCQQYSQS